MSVSYMYKYRGKIQKQIFIIYVWHHLTLSCWTQIYPAFAKNVNLDQLANWSGSALFDIKYVYL